MVHADVARIQSYSYEPRVALQLKPISFQSGAGEPFLELGQLRTSDGVMDKSVDETFGLVGRLYQFGSRKWRFEIFQLRVLIFLNFFCWPLIKKYVKNSVIFKSVKIQMSVCLCVYDCKCTKEGRIQTFIYRARGGFET